LTPEEYHLIKECIGIQSRPYYYFKDKYALDLANILLDRYQEVRIGDLKKSRFAFLLQKPPIKELVSSTGRNTISKTDLHSMTTLEGIGFFYSISEWGKYVAHRNNSYYQTSRPGINVVLRLNFDLKHNRMYNSLIKPDKTSHPFAFTGHPVSVKREYTMCWARLDVSLDTGEVLVEEIQNDWLRKVQRLLRRLEKLEKQNKDLSRFGILKNTTLDNFRAYYWELLKPYYKLWDEAMLNLVLTFAKEELGISQIFYHTFESGKYLKGYEPDWLPPRSIYTRLPKKFGFTETDNAPVFIQKEKYLRKKLRKKTLNWFSFTI